MLFGLCMRKGIGRWRLTLHEQRYLWPQLCKPRRTCVVVIIKARRHNFVCGPGMKEWLLSSFNVLVTFFQPQKPPKMILKVQNAGA